MDGMELLRRSQQIDPELPVVVITGHGDVQTAVEAMRLGAYDFIEKPFAPERFLEVVRRASEKRQLVVENRRLRRAVNEQTLASRIIGTSKAAETLRAAVAELAGTDVSVILYGETGVGKDLVARCLHDFGPPAEGQLCRGQLRRGPRDHGRERVLRARGRRVHQRVEGARRQDRTRERRHAVPRRDRQHAALRPRPSSCARCRSASIERLGSNRSIPVDLRADRGEQDRPAQGERRGQLPADLYYRLSVVELTVPPLRERIEDIPLLFEYFAASAAATHGRELRPVPLATMNMLMAQDWPGNVRELRNAAERYALGLARSLLPRDDGERAKPVARRSRSRRSNAR